MKIDWIINEQFSATKAQTEFIALERDLNLHFVFQEILGNSRENAVVIYG